MSQETIQETIRSAFDEIFHHEFEGLSSSHAEIARAKEGTLHDFQCNSAMKLAKQISLAPRVFAEKVAQSIEKRKDLFSSCSVAGPGFINFTLADSFLIEKLQECARQTELVFPAHRKERILVDFSSPNIAKEMHVGHLRSTILGDALARILEKRGHDVIRHNHIGDWGTSFGMLIAHLRSLPNFSHTFLLSLSLPQLMQLYRESKVRFDSDPIFRKASQQAVVDLQRGDEEHTVIWKEICEVSRQAYEEIYTLLHVRIDERGESFYNPWLKEIVERLEKQGVVELSEGAKCIFVEGISDREHTKLPLIIQKSDGGYNYDTTDMAALWHRVTVEKAERIIYVTDLGQATHFQLVFGAAKKASLLDPSKVRLDHVGFGLVLGPDGKKFKTRSGETEKLRDLLDAAVDKAKEIIRERNPEWTEKEVNALAHILGIGAVKYSDLSCNRLSDYTFSYDRMLRFEGNTAAFIMYSYVRSLSIIKKVAREDSLPTTLSQLFHPAERALAKQLLLFNDVLTEVEEQLLPNRLTEYLYTLAELFNQFFRDCRVEGDPRMNDRLFLVAMTMRTLKCGLELLGIEVPEKM